MLDSLLPEFSWDQTGLFLLDFLGMLLGTFLVYVAGQWLIKQALRRIFRPMIERERVNDPSRAARLTTLETVSGSVMLYALYFIVLGMLLSTVGLNPSSLIATAGVAGVALGFGAQKLVRDIVTGFLLLLEDQFRVGDLVKIGDNVGVVEETGMRITKLRDEVGRLIILSNGDINLVINYSKGEFRVGIDVAVAPDTNLQRMEEAVKSAALRLAERGSRVSHPQLRGVTAMSGASITYRVEASVPPTSRIEAEAELRAELRSVLTEMGVNLV